MKPFGPILLVAALAATSACTEAPSSAPSLGAADTGVAPSHDSSPAFDQSVVHQPSADAGAIDVALAPDGSPPPVNLITDIDFDHHAANTPYTDDLVDQDFRNYLTSSGPGNWGGSIAAHDPDKKREAMIVEDPVGTHGRVLRSTYFAKSSGLRFGARDHFSRTHYNLVPVGGEEAAKDYPVSAYSDIKMTPGRPPGEPGEQAPVREADPTQRRYDELYAAVDMMLSPGFKPIPYHKLWGLNTGSPEQASHGAVGCYSQEGYYGLLTWLLLTGNEWDRAGTSGSVGSMAMYEYNAEKIFVTRWLNRNDPTNTDRRNMAPQDFYIPPRGTWFTVEIHARLNTADDVYREVVDTSPQECGPGGNKLPIPGGYRADHATAGDLKDGLIEVWITDPRTEAEGGTAGVPKKMYESVLRQRWWNYLKYTQFFLQDWSNHNASFAEFYPDQDQYTYFDNIKVSQQRIYR